MLCGLLSQYKQRGGNRKRCVFLEMTQGEHFTGYKHCSHSIDRILKNRTCHPVPQSRIVEYALTGHAEGASSFFSGGREGAEVMTHPGHLQLSESNPGTFQVADGPWADEHVASAASASIRPSRTAVVT